ncbi:MAG: CRISPR-associated helicase Cas3' [Ignavibacteriaceae bacterium]|nr:CRISPR-associated helicase Cas3' [Ignavibacteriaceae bacterium]
MNLAHVKKRRDGTWAEPHPLKLHLEETAERAAKFAAEFGNGDWGRLVGLLHDLGKYHPDWQSYLRKKAGYYDEDAHIENYRSRPNHSSAGAIHLFEKFKNSPAAKLTAYVIAGHHSGLPDWTPQLYNRIFDNDCNLIKNDLDKIKPIDEAQEFLDCENPSAPPAVAKENPPDLEQFHLWVRMLFSSLVDADFIDTESYMDEKERGRYLPLDTLKQRFDNFIETKPGDNQLNLKRKEILDICRKKAELEPGFFSLTVPTGGGKTLSSMAFALEHAIKHKKKRIIVAIPYTSIIEQTAKVYKYGADTDEEIAKRLAEGNYLFGEDQVVEHHSNLDPETETANNRTACENWDAPIIVTTNVQLFESIFGNRTSVCRKLHNICNSVIILDEAQMLPTGYFRPILSVLEGLVKYFGVTVLLMSATQPALIGSLGSAPTIINGLENVREIIENPDKLALDFKRVEYHFPENYINPSSWEALAKQIGAHEQALCIVNTRNDCRALHKLMPEGTIHLSRFMCGEEISEIISEIKVRLKNGEPVRVISTQLVEAGVDIDFPVVYRAMTGLDSIVQASGRCNRENKLPEGGNVLIFVPPKNSPPGFLRKCEDACKAILRKHNEYEITPGLLSEYFTILYANLNSFDDAQFYDMMVRDAGNFEFSFRALAEKFEMIDSKRQISIIVRYTSSKSGKSSLPFIGELKYAGGTKGLIRKLQRYIVNVPVYIFNEIKKAGYVEDINGLWVQADENLYRPGIGLLANESDWIEGDFVI